jgi:hypothetical protein
MKTTDLSPTALSLLEYDYLQKAVDKFDGQRFQLRNWCILIIGAILALAFQSHSSTVAGLAVGTVLFFALSEGLYISMQRAVISRANELERVINSLAASGSPEYTFGISQAFVGKGKVRDAVKLLWRPGWLQTHTFYLSMLFGCVLAVILVA